MAKLKLTFEVDTIECFDRIYAVKDQGSLLGTRLIGVFLTGEQDTSTAIGLAYYGVEFKGSEKLNQQDTRT